MFSLVLPNEKLISGRNMEVRETLETGEAGREQLK